MCTTTYTALPPHTTFRYPSYNRQYPFIDRWQYPFDEVCERIARALARRNWKVPGIEVKFSDGGTGESKYRCVRTIKGENFRLGFCRPYNVSELTIPKRELRVYLDESGPTYWHFIGDDWDIHKTYFMKRYKFDAKGKGLPRFYLKYHGTYTKPNDREHTTFARRGKRNPFLSNDTDMNREYAARENEPQYFETEQVYREFTVWITANVLQVIESFDIAMNVELTSEPKIPYPEHLEPFYVKVDHKTYTRIVKGKEDKDQLLPCDRYALIGGGRRLVSLDVTNDGTVPKEAYEGFTYCSFEIPKLTGKEYYTREDGGIAAIVRITPKYANRIYVADDAARIKHKEECFKKKSDSRYLTDEEYNECQRCRGRTIVPIEKYTGNYEKPTVLIEYFREIPFDEVEIEKVLEEKQTEEANESYCVIL